MYSSIPWSWTKSGNDNDNGSGPEKSCSNWSIGHELVQWTEKRRKIWLDEHDSKIHNSWRRVRNTLFARFALQLIINWEFIAAMTSLAISRNWFGRKLLKSAVLCRQAKRIKVVETGMPPGLHATTAKGIWLGLPYMRVAQRPANV